MSNYGKKDLKSFVRIDGSGRVVAGSLVLRRKMPKNGNWKQLPAYAGGGITEGPVAKAFTFGGASVDDATACLNNTGLVTYYHFGLKAEPEVGTLVWEDEEGTIPFVSDGSPAYYHTTDVPGEGFSLGITGSVIISIVKCP